MLLEADIVLNIWLKTVPEYAAVFLRLTLLISLVSVVSNTLVTSMLATGDIKRYQIIVGGLGMCVFPLAYVAFRLGLPVEFAYFIHLIIFIVQLICRLFLLRGMVKLKIKYFWDNALLKDLQVIFLSSIFPLSVFILMSDSLLRFLVIVIVSILSNLTVMYIAGMSKNERGMIKSYVIKLKNKF